MLDFLTSGLTGATLTEQIVYTLVMTHITIVAVTVYLHRAQAHRALEVASTLGHFFRLWLWLTTGMSTRAWAAIHRKHHAKCETPEDPHSPQTRGLKEVFWKGAELYKAEAKNTETLKKYGHGTPDDWLENKLYSRFTWHGCAVMLFTDFALFGLPGVSIWAIQMIWIPFWAAGFINGVGHFWGYRNFDCPDASRNVFPWGILIGGEELHNNHHTHATSAKLSAKWYEFDIGWMYIRIFSMLGWVKIKKVAERPKFKTKAHLDLDSVQALVNHRYELMARYARDLKQALNEEAARLKHDFNAREQKGLLAHYKKLLATDESKLSAEQHATLSELCQRSQLMATLVEKRRELRAIWERTNLSREQMLAQLQAWCDNAEQSGIRWLEEMSLRIRRYA